MYKAILQTTYCYRHLYSPNSVTNRVGTDLLTVTYFQKVCPCCHAVLDNPLEWQRIWYILISHCYSKKVSRQWIASPIRTRLIGRNVIISRLIYSAYVRCIVCNCYGCIDCSSKALCSTLSGQAETTHIVVSMHVRGVYPSSVPCHHRLNSLIKA